MAVKEGCMNNPIVKGQYQTADSPIFEVCYLEERRGKEFTQTRGDRPEPLSALWEVRGDLPEAGDSPWVQRKLRWSFRRREKELGMDQGERRKFLIRELLQENAQYRDVEIPTGEEEQRQLLRGLMNVRLPGRIGRDRKSVV